MDIVITWLYDKHLNVAWKEDSVHAIKRNKAKEIFFFTC